MCVVQLSYLGPVFDHLVGSSFLAVLRICLFYFLVSSRGTVKSSTGAYFLKLAARMGAYFRGVLNFMGC